MVLSRKFLLFTMSLVALIALSSTANAGDTSGSLITDGHFFGEVRYRYEYVDQDGPAPIADDAKAGTIRTNIGFKSGKYQNFQALLEGQIVQSIGANDFNDTVNGQTNFPVIADPDNQEINQAWLSWSGIEGAEIKLGRQGINLDNQRFIGTVDWRQNDQTFDSVVFNYSGIDKVNFAYGYIGNVNRIFGDDHPLGDLDSTSHFANASYKFTDALKLTGYGYIFDFDRLPTRSSQTYGLRVTGKTPINENWAFNYEAEIARQSDYGSNSAHYNETYYHLAPSITGHGFTFGVGYEVLGGDGTNAFQTPLATLHKFNGWADKFLDTPARGLEDAYVSASYKISDVHQALDGTTVTVVYHDFKGDQSGDFGSELDASVGKSFELPKELPFEKFNVLVKYADYNAEDAPYTDTQKIWLQIGVNF